MSTIEFRCPQCDKLLRVGATYAGKDARCPQCGTVSKIPSAQPQAGREAEEHPLGPLPQRPSAAAPHAEQRQMPAPLGTTPMGTAPMGAAPMGTVPATQPSAAATDPPR